ncbi:RtcB family protein [Hymenobacter taeanensis]|uniref:3'-phosphate/5'-hydroxy nucleic acid ligase n=1 Tax=Hymenobacter taeanensis TaxID=2735321 RepID=A0A6M6BPW8_9BACT|nr:MULTISPECIES: RtcB family protein [Hymenobacter]QJX49025.1 RtcB family protein [Hymenobacter taeanensis]UOQ81458.1 RtcB family protein [Hymenobacter sp. 5414T-23]
MANQLRGNDLRQLGFPEGRAIGLALAQLQRKHLKKLSQTDQLVLLKSLLADPSTYLTHLDWSHTAAALLPAPSRHIALTERKPYAVFGPEYIEQGAIHQMETAMKLPVTVAGALMPDAHHGYGLPIGGVLATDNAVIPYAVGVDIGCRMALSVFALPPRHLEQRVQEMRKLLLDNTRFGNRQGFQRGQKLDHAVLERDEFSNIAFLRNKQGTAAEQIGTSGSGNHFVEWGIVDILDPQNELGVPVGQYVGLLSHSGSRGLGASVANHYTKLAKDVCQLPSEAQHLAWLSLESEAGQEYWAAMNLAGDYASACHHQIHQRLAKALGERPLAKVENHHNFAWKERLADGREVVVHRKGATPASAGVLGVIPGSMTAPGFIVRGRGNADSLASASHGAGRAMSRTRAKQELSEAEVRRYLQQHGIELIGGGVDEAPQAYKDIHAVMQSQQELVDVLGTFTPRIVRMDGA